MLNSQWIFHTALSIPLMQEENTDSVKLEIGYDCTLPPQGSFVINSAVPSWLCFMLPLCPFIVFIVDICRALIRQLCRALVQFYQKTYYVA